MRKMLILSSLSALVLASGAAAAAGPTISIKLQPNKADRHSTLSIAASGFPTESSLPTSLELVVQKGFKTSTRSVAKLCVPTKAACPPASKIGTGTANVTAGNVPLVGTINDTVNFTLYLGTPKQSGDIASVVLIGSDTTLHQTASGSGRLFRTGAGELELLFDKFPAISGLPPGVTLTIDNLSLSAHAMRTVKTTKTRHHRKVTIKHVYSLITNPGRCSGRWTGTASVTFPGQTMSFPLSAGCTK